MEHKNYTPELIELIAKNILLSRGGSVYPGSEDLRVEVIDKDGNITPKKVASIHFTPGWEHPWYVAFINGAEGIVQDPEDLMKIWGYIIENFAFPDKDILIEKDALEQRLKLRERNITFIARHGDINQDDIAMMENYRKAIEDARDAVKDRPVPLTGDIVEGAYYDGKYPFKNGVIESTPHWKKELSVCAQPYTPFIHFRTNEQKEIGLSVSGGPFFGFNIEDLEYVGADTRWFCDWGHSGVCAQGALDFPARVNRWKVKQEVKY